MVRMVILGLPSAAVMRLCFFLSLRPVANDVSVSMWIFGLMIIHLVEAYGEWYAQLHQNRLMSAASVEYTYKQLSNFLI